MPHRHKHRAHSMPVPTCITPSSNLTTTSRSLGSGSLDSSQHHDSGSNASHHLLPLPSRTRRKSVQFDLGHNTQRVLPRQSTKAWKKLEKQIADLGLNSPATRAFGDYFVCERHGHPEVIIRSPPCELAAKLMAQGSVGIRPDSGLSLHVDDDFNSSIHNHDHDRDLESDNDVFIMDSDDSDLSPIMSSKRNELPPTLLEPVLIEETLRKFSLSRVPHHSILHYPKDNNMFVDWRQLDLMVRQTEALPEDLQDTDFGMKTPKSGKKSASSHLSPVSPPAMSNPNQRQQSRVATLTPHKSDRGHSPYRNKNKRHHVNKSPVVDAVG